MSKTAIQRLNDVLMSLIDDSLSLDANITKFYQDKSKRRDILIKNQHFSGDSEYFEFYIKQCQRNLASVERFYATNDIANANNSLLQVEQQIASIINAINAEKTRQKNIQTKRFYSKNNAAQRAVELLVSNANLSTKSLYEKHAEYLGFERRLLDMVRDCQFELDQSKPKDQSKLQQKLLALHQRLGKCRKAITQVEDEITRLEKHSK